MTITEKTTVADIASAIPSSVRVFQRYGIDFCCGGKTAVGAACEARGIPLASITAAIEETAAAGAPNERDWNTEPPAALIEHIVKTYHDRLRDDLPRLTSMAARVADAHGSRDESMRRIGAVVRALADDLFDHMRKEELVLFPAIASLTQGRVTMSISAPVAVMEHEHDHAGALLEQLSAMTGGYDTQSARCGTARALFRELGELDAMMKVHVHLENNVLFPRALALQRRG